MEKDKKQRFDFEEYEYQLCKSDVRVARLFGFTLGFVFAIAVIAASIYCNGKI